MFYFRRQGCEFHCWARVERRSSQKNAQNKTKILISANYLINDFSKSAGNAGSGSTEPTFRDRKFREKCDFNFPNRMWARIYWNYSDSCAASGRSIENQTTNVSWWIFRALACVFASSLRLNISQANIDLPSTAVQTSDATKWNPNDLKNNPPAMKNKTK